MKKHELQEGDKFTFRNGSEYYVTNSGYETEDGVNIGKLNDFNEDLTDSLYKDFDIMEVERNGQTVWERSNALDEIVDMSYEIDVILQGFESQLGDWEDAKRARELLLDLVCKIKEL